MHALWLRKEEWSLTMVLQDVQGYALRAFRFRPGFAAVAILTLAVGIGASTAVFSVVHGVLLKPLPYGDPDRLVQIWEINPARNWTHEAVAPANFLDWKARSRSFSAMAYYIGSDTQRAESGRCHADRQRRSRAAACDDGVLELLHRSWAVSGAGSNLSG